MPELMGDSDQLENSMYISEHLGGVVVGPGCGEGALSSTDFIDEMLGDFLVTESVGVIVSWFADGITLPINIKPGVEKKSGEAQGAELEWRVGQFDRGTAHQLRRSNPLDPATVGFGGTMPDSDVLKCFSALKEKGLETAFYPFILVDDASKSWRGFISGDANEVENFYLSQYKSFIMHYVTLLKDVVDIFYLGSELEGLTSVKGEGRDFPFACCLVNLAAEVKGVLGSEVKISYAANWTEYHSCLGGYRPLDLLWSNANINFVGIDYYMPLTDKQGDEEITLQEIKAGFTSGEGYDYYLDASGEQVVISKAEPWNRWKDLEYWHSSDHWALGQESSGSYRTDWKPGSKPIVFSEFGFRSVDKSTNQPHLVGSQLPRHSTGKQDIPLQLRAIRATIEHFKESDFIEAVFAYPYDSRGKGWQEVFADGFEWKTGHWIDGKLR